MDWLAARWMVLMLHNQEISFWKLKNQRVMLSNIREHHPQYLDRSNHRTEFRLSKLTCNFLYRWGHLHKAGRMLFNLHIHRSTVMQVSLARFSMSVRQQHKKLQLSKRCQQPPKFTITLIMLYPLRYQNTAATRRPKMWSSFLEMFLLLKEIR